MNPEFSEDANPQVTKTHGQDISPAEILLADSSVPCQFANRILCPGGGSASPGQVQQLEKLPTYKGPNPSAERVQTPSQAEIERARDIASTGGIIPALRGYDYDFGSEGLNALIKAHQYSLSDHMTEDDRRTATAQINDQREAILNSKHDIKAIENVLAHSPEMQSLFQRARVGAEINESLQNVRNGGDRRDIAKVSRDVVLWNIAYIDAAEHNRIEKLSPDQIDELRKLSKNFLAQAYANDAQNPDFAQLRTLAESFGITLD